jgi:hypothetical protein
MIRDIYVVKENIRKLSAFPVLDFDVGGVREQVNEASSVPFYVLCGCRIHFIQPCC